MPQTLAYFLAGYGVIFGLLGAYCLFLARLHARLKRSEDNDIRNHRD